MVPSHEAEPLQAPSTKAKIAVLVALAALLFIVGLGSVPLLEPDEPYYAVPAREMLESGSWQVPIFHGRPWFDKPILFYWMILGAYRLLGVSEFAARIGSALAALVAVLAVYLAGRRSAVVGGRSRLDERAAFVAALILATNLEYVLMARAAVTDMTLTASLTLGMLAAARYLGSGRSSSAFLAGLAFGLAILTKGPVGLLLPGVALLAYATLLRRGDLLRPSALAAGAAGVLLIASPWYLYMLFAHRDLLITTFIGEGNLGRFLSPEHVWFPGYYLAVLAFGLLPWSGGLPASLVSALGSARGSGEEGSRGSSGERGAGRPPGPLYELCWFGSVLLVFSLSASKLASYILPAFPPAAMLLGRYWHARLASGSSAHHGRGPRSAAWVGVVLAGAIAAALAHAGSSEKLKAAGPAAAATGAVLLAGSLVAVVMVRRGSLAGLCAVQSGTCVAVVLLLLCLAVPRLEPLVSARPLVRDLERRGLAGEVLGIYRRSEEFGLDYYLGRSMTRIKKLEELRRQVAESPGGIWILRTGDLDTIAGDPSLAATEVAHGPELSAARLTPRPGALGGHVKSGGEP